jgi:RNA polymerase sigma factor (sigma-70 family)
MEKHQEQAEVIQLYNEASPELLRLLQYKLGSLQEAEEVAQDAFEKLCRVAAKNDIEDLRKYFFTMANRMALNVLRRRHVENDYLSEQQNNVTDISGSSFSPEAIAGHHEKLILIKSALKALPEKSRHVFLLHRFEGYTYPEIAEQMGLSRKSIEYHMSRALTAVVEASKGA